VRQQVFRSPITNARASHPVFRRQSALRSIMDLAGGGAYMSAMCGRIIQSGGPLQYAIVDGMNARDSRVHNVPPGRNGAPRELSDESPSGLRMIFS
jgi:hypothetical protein